jgi:hypothetical protein
MNTQPASNTIYMPYVGNFVPTRPRFGVGIKVQSTIPTDVTLDLLNPPCYHNWGPWAAPGWMNESQPLHGYERPGFQPASWNPPENQPDGTLPDFAMTWAQTHVAANPGAFWLIGNEPVRAEPPYTAWCPVWRMAEHCIQFARYHNVPIAPFGGVAMHDSDYAYGDDLRHKLNAAGVKPVAWHWHIYPASPGHWLELLQRVMRWAGDTPVVITETNMWHAEDQRPLMDTIVQALAAYPGQLNAVYWYVNWEPPVAGLPNRWQLLTTNDPNTALTETGRHYIERTR